MGTEQETRVRYAKLLKREMSRTGLRDQDLADHLGYSRGVVRKWMDERDKSQMRLHDIARAPARLARPLLEALAHDHHLDVLVADDAPDAFDHEAHFDLLMQELTEAYQHYRAVLRTHNGLITDPELRSLEKEVTEARDALTMLANWIVTERQSRGID